jgi:hypothetical protein
VSVLEWNVAINRFQADALFFELDGFAASSFEMTHEVDACFGSFLFFLEVFFEAYFFDASIVVCHKRVPFALILSVLAGHIIVAQKTALQLLLFRARSVWAPRCAAASEAHGTLGAGEPF